MTLGEFIKKYREEHDLSQRAFGRLCGMSVQYVCNLERGLNNDGKKLSPTMATYAKVARGMGMSEAELLLSVDDTVDVNPQLSNREILLVHKFRGLDEDGKRAVEAAAAGAKDAKRKVIPLFAAAAGHGEPARDDFDKYEVEETSPAQFAVKISGDSMEPELHDGDIVLCRRKKPEIGELAVIMVNGFLYVKQYIEAYGNIYLRSLNRTRKDCDVDILRTGNDTVTGYGTVIFKRVPLVEQ